jgi:hypothetical protein
MFKVEYKKPLILADLPWWPHNAYGIIDTSAFYVMNEKDWTISGTWKRGDDESQIDEMAGIFIRRGLHTGLVYRKPDMLMINFWYIDGDDEKYADKILFYKEESFWNEPHLFTLNWNSKTFTYEVWIDDELVHSETLNGKLRNYENSPYFIGAADTKGDFSWAQECYTDFFMVSEKKLDGKLCNDFRKDIKNKITKNKHGFNLVNKTDLGLLCCFDFKNETPYKFWDITGNNNHLMKHCKDLEKL